jgi:hypothetical protein
MLVAGDEDGCNPLLFKVNMGRDGGAGKIRLFARGGALVMRSC